MTTKSPPNDSYLMREGETVEEAYERRLAWLLDQEHLQPGQRLSLGAAADLLATTTLKVIRDRIKGLFLADTVRSKRIADFAQKFPEAFNRQDPLLIFDDEGRAGVRLKDGTFIPQLVTNIDEPGGDLDKE